MKWKVMLRDDSNAADVRIEERIIEFEGTIDELRSHSHIVSVIEKVEEEKEKETEETKKSKTK